jgi:hypothetical protein
MRDDYQLVTATSKALLKDSVIIHMKKQTKQINKFALLFI